jgi:ABC-2 type transport system permease protein
MTAAATASRRAGGAPRVRYSLADVARMEWIKLRTLRWPAWVALVVLVSMIGLAYLVLPRDWANTPASVRAQWDPTNAGFAGMAIWQLAIGIGGVLVMSGEYSSGSIRSTLAAIPDRRMLLAGKAAVLGLAALVFGELTCFADFFIGQYLVISAPEPHASLGQPGVLRAVLMMGAYMALIGLIGLAIGTIIRHTAGAIALVVGLVLVLPALLVALPATLQNTVGMFLPMMIAENSISVVRPTVAHSLPPWAGLGMMILYAAAALLIGGWLLARRDA